jgi:hypothetical protein
MLDHTESSRRNSRCIGCRFDELIQFLSFSEFDDPLLAQNRVACDYLSRAFSRIFL